MDAATFAKVPEEETAKAPKTSPQTVTSAEGGEMRSGSSSNSSSRILPPTPDPTRISNTYRSGSKRQFNDCVCSSSSSEIISVKYPARQLYRAQKRLEANEKYQNAWVPELSRVKGLIQDLRHLSGRIQGILDQPNICVSNFCSPSNLNRYPPPPIMSLTRALFF